MAATSYDSLLPHVLIDALGVPDLTALSAINMAARELCIKSNCWFESQEIPLIDGVYEYQLDTPNANAIIHGIRQVMINGRELRASNEITAKRDDAKYLEQSGYPQMYFPSSPDTIQVFPKPDSNCAQAGIKLLARCSFAPTVSATSFDSSLTEYHAETIIAGAKARVLAMPSQSWSNPALAVTYKQMFDEMVTKARIEVETSFGSGDLTVRHRRFGA